MSVLRSYLRLVGRHASQGGLRRDGAQVALAERLDGLLDELGEHKVSLAKYEVARGQHRRELERQVERITAMKVEQRKSEGGGLFGFMAFAGAAPVNEEAPSRKLLNEARAEAENIVGPPPKKPPAPKSIYLHGHVGVGKTFLMDLFYQGAQDVLHGGASGGSVGTCRMHFNSTMMELHQHMHRIEKNYYEKDKFKLNDPGKLAVLAARRRRVTNMKVIFQSGRPARRLVKLGNDLRERVREAPRTDLLSMAEHGRVFFDEIVQKQREEDALINGAAEEFEWRAVCNGAEGMAERPEE